MILSDILKNIDVVASTGNLQREITGVNMDSRQVKPGNLFVAVKGTQTDGHAFIGKALEQGAVAVLQTNALPAEAPEGVTLIQVADTEDAVGKVATQFYGDPSHRLKPGGRNGYERQNNHCYRALRPVPFGGTQVWPLLNGVQLH